MGRRNLTDEQRAYIQGKLYEMKKKDRKLNLKQYSSNCNFCSSEKEGSTAKKIGSLYGSSERKIHYAYDFAQAIDKVREEKPEAAEKILRGEVKGVIYARINDDLEKEFRVEVAKIYGGTRGAISKAIEEAIRLWLEKNQANKLIIPFTNLSSAFFRIR